MEMPQNAVFYICDYFEIGSIQFFINEKLSIFLNVLYKHASEWQKLLVLSEERKDS